MTQADERTKRVYEFIIQHKKANDGISPTLHQIKDACGITSVSVVTFYLKRLQRDGLIKRIDRRIHVVGGRWTLESLKTACPPHTFHVDHRRVFNDSLIIEIDGAVITRIPTSDVFAYCPNCNTYLSGARITDCLNQNYHLATEEE